MTASDRAARIEHDPLLSLAQAEWLQRQGRMSHRQFRRYLALWTWGAWRSEGAAGRRQHAFSQAHGELALYRRVNAVRRIIGADQLRVPPHVMGLQ